MYRKNWGKISIASWPQIKANVQKVVPSAAHTWSEHLKSFTVGNMTM